MPKSIMYDRALIEKLTFWPAGDGSWEVLAQVTLQNAEGAPPVPIRVTDWAELDAETRQQMEGCLTALTRRVVARELGLDAAEDRTLVDAGRVLTERDAPDVKR